jgi:rSAM/selenodomain-associated transferase 2
LKLSVVIPAFDAAATLARAIVVLGDAAEVIVVDGGSSDDTAKIAARLGARVIRAAKGRGSQLSAGAAEARGDWLLFIHADTYLESGWREAVESFAANRANRAKAATFRFKLDHEAAPARWLEKMVTWRAQSMGLPYGDQGLLIHRDFYWELGGFRSMPIMEDVDLVLRIGRRRLVALPAAARTSANRWHQDGWLWRSSRNLFCLTLYFLRVPPTLIARIYH